MQTDEELQVIEDLSPEIVDGALTFIGDDEVEGLDGDGGVVLDRWWFLVEQLTGREEPSFFQLGIDVFAPCPWKREKEVGNGQTETEQGIFLRAVHVFDVSQTDGPFRASKKASVEVNSQHPTGQQPKTLVHELAREAMHWDARGPFTRSMAELEAESVAYVVCMRFGLDVEVRASRYIAVWHGDSKALRASLEPIANTAREIIGDLETVVDRKAVEYGGPACTLRSDKNTEQAQKEPKDKSAYD